MSVAGTQFEPAPHVGNGKPKIVAEYDYRDERGTLLYQSVRLEPGNGGRPKDFRQRRPDGHSGEWIWNLKDTRLVPYRLPELLAADPSRPVFVVEGEKDVDSLLAIELPATTNPMGAGKWQPELSHSLTGRMVFILPDNDEPGRKHAADVARKLAGIAESVAVVELPGLAEKGDVSDWLAVPGNDKIKLLKLCQSAAKGDAYEGIDAQSTTPKQPPPVPQKPPAQSRFLWQPIDSARFATSDYRPAWLAVKAIVEKQPLIFGGPQKVLKTSFAIDLAVALSSATPWLGHFPCPSQKRVAVLSGESGPWALQSIARRVCDSKGIELASLGDNLRWLFSLPQLGVQDQLDALQVGLKHDGVEVVIVDPLYLCLLGAGDGGQASNLYETGPLLLRVAEACLGAGATPILLHHCTKPSAGKRDPLDLADLAFSGVAEFARQWILLSRREAYDPDTGKHALWMVAGGSVGHGGLWAVDVDEGKLAEDFSGRKWEVSVNAAVDARQRDASDKEQARRQKQETAEQADASKVLSALGVKDPDRMGVSFTALRDAAGLSGPRFGAAVTRLQQAGEVKEFGGTAKAGQGAKRPARIIQRTGGDSLL